MSSLALDQYPDLEVRKELDLVAGRGSLSDRTLAIFEAAESAVQPVLHANWSLVEYVAGEVLTTRQISGAEFGRIAVDWKNAGGTVVSETTS